MNLTLAQLQTLKANMAANNNTIVIGGSTIAIKDVAQTPDNAQAVADWYNLVGSPDYWVWRTTIFESEITRTTTPDSTVWSWTIYIARTQGERDAWTRLFMGGGSGMNPSLTNVRQGLADIFSGAPGAAQRTHLLAVSRRKSTNAEKLYGVVATGPGNDGGTRGTTTNPDNLPTGFGDLNTVTFQNVQAAWIS